MSTEFTDNLEQFLSEKLLEFNPNIITSEGTAIRDLFIKPISIVMAPLVDEITSTRENLSLANAPNLSDEALDSLAANFYVTRKEGSKATGSVRLFFSEVTDEALPQGTVFVAVDGTRFVSLSEAVITTAGLSVNASGALFYHDIDVEAEEVGVAGNVPEDAISELLFAKDKIVEITNQAETTGGSEAETNAELISRLAIAITFRNLINENGAKLILLENFDRLLDVVVAGKGSTFQITDENIGTGDDSSVTFQLSETEDVVDDSVFISLEVQDETVAASPVGTGSYNLDFYPIDSSSLELRIGASFLAGTALVEGTDYDIVDASTGEIEILVAQGSDLHAKYDAIDIDSSFFSSDFYGAVTFTSPPSAGTIVLATFRAYLMRRDRLSGDNLVLGDDTFGTVTNVHIGGKVDYYLKFAGVQEKEQRINFVTGEAFLFEQGETDPNPEDTQQYVSDIELPIISIKEIEKVDPATNLPSGEFLSDGVTEDDELVGVGTGSQPNFQLDNYPVNPGTLELRVATITGTLLVETTDYAVNLDTGSIVLTAAGMAALATDELHAKYTTGDYTLDILDGKLNINMSTRQKVKITLVDQYLDIEDELVGTGDTVESEYQLDYFPVLSGTLELHVDTIAGVQLTEVTDYTVDLSTGAISLTAAGITALGTDELRALYEAGPTNTFSGSDVFLRYYTHQDFETIQAFIEDDVNRIVTADLLARAPMPVFVDIDVRFARPGGEGATEEEVVEALENYIDRLSIGEALTVYNIATELANSNVKFVDLPLTISAERVNLDFSKLPIVSSNRIEIPPNFQIVARDITATEIDPATLEEV